jgi:hypothetical protein
MYIVPYVGRSAMVKYHLGHAKQIDSRPFFKWGGKEVHVPLCVQPRGTMTQPSLPVVLKFYRNFQTLT